jgi:hypothetical protein
VVRDPGAWDGLDRGAAHLFGDSFECTLVGVTETRRRGLVGLPAIWTIRGGRVVEAFYANRDDAFEAAGLSRREAGARVPKPAS